LQGPSILAGKIYFNKTQEVEDQEYHDLDIYSYAAQTGELGPRLGISLGPFFWPVAVEIDQYSLRFTRLSYQKILGPVVVQLQPQRWLFDVPNAPRHRAERAQSQLGIGGAGV
jgi:hypothetical protein